MRISHHLSAIINEIHPKIKIWQATEMASAGRSELDG